MRPSCTPKLAITLVALWCIATIVHAMPDEGLRKVGKVGTVPEDPSAAADPSAVEPAAPPPPAIGDPLGPGETGPALDPATPEDEKKNQVLSCITSCGANFQCSNGCITTTYGTAPAPAAQGGTLPAATPPNPAAAPASATGQPPQAQPSGNNQTAGAGSARPQNSGGMALETAGGLVGLLAVVMASLLVAL
ncbi:hypothetical protein DFQ26_006017 [Actinomortierella ambigua]|nr:hypothetical protein DFQ26_006017 [Actinomortierella ambigua]